MTWLLKSINHLQNGSSDLPCRDWVHIPPGEVQKNIIDLCKSADWLVGCMWYTSKEGTEGTPKTWSKINAADLISRHLRKLRCRHGWGDTYESKYWCFTRVWLQGHLSTTLIFSTYQIPWRQQWGCFGQPPPVWHSPLGSSCLKGGFSIPPCLVVGGSISPPWGGSKIWDSGTWGAAAS